MKNSPANMRPFDVHIPNLDGDGIAETVRIEVPFHVDPTTGEEVLAPEAHTLIEKTKLRCMGILSPEEIENLRERLGLTQEEMSDLLQIGAKSYTRWESGRARPSRSMNVLLCALRDGQLDVNYLRQLRDPELSCLWFLHNRLRSLTISCPGSVKLNKESDFTRDLVQRSKAWFSRVHEFYASSDMVVHMTNEYPTSPWLIAECKVSESADFKPMRRTVTPPMPENQNVWRGFRRPMADLKQTEETLSS